MLIWWGVVVCDVSVCFIRFVYLCHLKRRYDRNMETAVGDNRRLKVTNAARFVSIVYLTRRVFCFRTRWTKPWLISIPSNKHGQAFVIIKTDMPYRAGCVSIGIYCCCFTINLLSPPSRTACRSTCSRRTPPRTPAKSTQRTPHRQEEDKNIDIEKRSLAKSLIQPLGNHAQRGGGACFILAVDTTGMIRVLFVLPIRTKTTTPSHLRGHGRSVGQREFHDAAAPFVFVASHERRYRRRRLLARVTVDVSGVEPAACLAGVP